MKQLITLILALFLASVSLSQNAEDPGDTEAEATDVSETNDAGDAGDAGDASEEEDDSYLDEQEYGADEEEDDFVPSQEVSADQALPFPVDI